MIFRQPFKMDWPITQKYGEKVTSSFHTGIDYGCPLNTPVLASADGKVMFAGWDSTGYGNMVIVKHTDFCSTLYAHLSSVHVSVGETVRRGSLIGHSGNTGNSTGPHLHFEARSEWNDYRSHFDPMKLPLTTIDDTVIEKPVNENSCIKPGPVMVSAPLGVFAHNEKFTNKHILPYGTELDFTGKTKQKNGLTFCECTVWVASSDGDTQLLTNIDYL